jgi:hypothetical protein
MKVGSMIRRKLMALIAGGAAAVVVAASGAAQTTGSISKPARTGTAETYSAQEIIDTGHRFFGRTTRGLAEAVEYVFKSQGEPTAYIVGEEGAGAFIGGLRYGEGTIYYKSGGKNRIYWQGPSVGFDFGGNGSRSLVLVYNSASPSDIMDNRFVAVEGSAYLVGGLSVSFQQHDQIIMAPIRTGVGARLGANMGYFKYTGRPEWNPF